MVPMCSVQGVTALHHVAVKGNYHCVKLLIEAGADVNKQTKDAMEEFMLGFSWNVGMFRQS